MVFAVNIDAGINGAFLFASETSGVAKSETRHSTAVGTKHGKHRPLFPPAVFLAEALDEFGNAPR
jgi:hypothetical protein